jgi:hypothetical protein
MCATKILEQHLQDLEDTWAYTREELADIREKFIDFAHTVASDENMREEIANIKKMY